jgi:DNA topoisomerase II
MAYEKLDQISHILKRSDMYVGSTRMLNDDEWIFDQDKIQKREIEYNPGLLRIFVEVLSNVIDNVWRSQEQSIATEKITIIIDNEMISVTNDGRGIPFTNYKDTDIPIPELIFGHLLTSTNYNDQEERLTSGRNGLGVKLTNVFSKKFEIELHNKDTQQIYKQKWENHMRKCHSPSIKSKAVKSNMVCIKFYPDFSCFGLDGMTPDILSMFSKYCVDTAMITKLPVTLNKDKIKIKQFMDYVKMYPVNSKECIVLEKKEDMDLVLCSSDNGYQEIVFTNGVFNKQGGVHIDNIMNEICKSLLTKINTKLKSSLTVKDLKPHFTVFLNCKLVNPSFNNQSKDRLMSPNMKYKFDPKYVTNIMKWEFVEKIKENIQMKELKTIKKMERKRVRIEGYDPANLSGTKRSSECTLILSEGLSSKSYGINGMNIGIDGKKGRDYFGVLPLRGVLMNARNATLQSIMNNKEIMNIASILNLKYNHENKIEDLNYGKLLILVDSDKDGIHIASLILNFIDVLYPSLLKQEFVYMMLTPIAKINDNVFYNEYDYVSFLKSHETSKNLKIKYYKGLGTSSAQEIKETFGKKIVKFVLDDEAKHHLNKVFHQKFADQRKEWLANYDINSYIPIQEECLISNYINHELIKFSIYDCERNIPNLFDGLKISQRKILYSVIKRNLHYKNKSMKIAQLGGYVAEVSNYHHGENCLFDTITKMTQSFVGTNNYPLLYPDGNCGSRNNLGKDAANARYIYTRMQEYTPHIFMKEDDSNLNYQYEDNEYVEPDFYIPIIPMILVNGCQTAIGTGWSSTLPAFNLEDILKYINIWLDNKDKNIEIPFIDVDIKPYWKNFKGEIQKISDVKYISRGIFKVSDKGKYVIEEIPVYVSIDKYKEFLESLVDDKNIKNFKNYSTTNNIHFEFNLCGNFEATYESLKLTNTINLTNMVLFTKNKKLHKFHSITEILGTFCNERYDRYITRKKHMVRKLKKNISILENKHRFLQMILSNEIILNKYQDNEDIYKLLLSLKFMNDEDEKFSYLLNIPIRSMTKTRLLELEQSIKNSKKELSDLERTTITNMWRNDLKTLVDLL